MSDDNSDTNSDATANGAELISFIAKALVSEPDKINVVVGDDGRTLELETAEDDRGRVIGRQGRVAKAMRAVLGKSGGGQNLRLDIVD
jgi:predicted RNA-binding protein YlqC (UPF0109 family)